MRNIVKGLRSLGYQITISRLSNEEKTVWGSMIASAVSEQISVNLAPAEKAEWSKMVEGVSCLNCAYNGEEFCSSHN